MPIVPDLSGVGPGAIASPHVPQSSEFAGWSPVLAASFLTPQKLVVQVIDYEGGGPGVKPPTGFYISSAGYTLNSSLATNFLSVGVAGPAGAQLLYGTGAPTGGTGNDGDSYIDTATYLIYGPKAAGVWPTGVSLVGPAGAGTGDMLAAQNLNDLANKATARTNLGVAIGSNVQAYSAVLATLAGASANGQSLITAANYAAMKVLLACAIADVTGLQAALDAKEKFGAYNARNPQTGTAYTLVLADQGKLVETNNAAANTVTVPPNSSVAFPINTRIDIIQYGAGQTTIVQGVGANLRAVGGKLKLTSQFSGASLYKRGADEWIVLGDLTS
jgi:hypothetical protein